MAVNNWFITGLGPGRKSETDLAEDLVVEMIQMAGSDYYYIPRTINKIDPIFGEDPLSKFEQTYIIEMYLSNATEFGGNGQLLGKFGLEIQDTIELVVARRRFMEQATSQEYPKEGDLIYMPLTKTLWQIDYVDHEAAPFYQLKKNYTWTLKCSLYTYSYEEFDTGVQQVDVDLDKETYTTPFDRSEEIQDEARDSLDWSESSPFGDPVPKEDEES